VVCYDSPLGIAGKEVAEIERSDIPVYPLPERAARALSGLVESSKISQKKGKGA
jgi:acyl-CoA synthetase (NDP forming)